MDDVCLAFMREDLTFLTKIIIPFSPKVGVVYMWLGMHFS